jgi:hypothetical protein
MTELFRRNVAAVLNDLPEVCFSRLNATGEPVTIRRGHVGYTPTDATCDAERLNAGLTAAQVMAMEVGSMMGFDCPAADPLNYPELAQACWYLAGLRMRWMDASLQNVLAARRDAVIELPGALKTRG